MKEEKGRHKNGNHHAKPTNRHISSTHREAEGLDDEAGVLLYAPAIRQGAYTTESAFCAAADCLRPVLCQGQPVGQKAAAPASCSSRRRPSCSFASMWRALTSVFSASTSAARSPSKAR